MKFSIQREALLRPLSQVTGVVERRQTLPVLANLLVKSDEGGVSFTGTDLEVELVARIGAEVSDGGEVTVPARKLYEICKALPDGTQLDIEIGSERGTINAGRSRFVLAALPATDFPVIEDVDVGDAVELAADDLVRILDRTAFAMANQDVRYYLNGLLVELRSGLVRSVATDGHRLAIADVEVELDLPEVRQIIVPRKGVLELQRLLGEVGGDLRLELGRSHIRAHLGDSIFTSKLIDGRFPDYEAVVPVGADKSVVADRLALREALQRAAILSNEKYRGIKLEVEPGRLRIVAHNPEQEEAVEELEVDTDVDGLAVGFNVNYLLDALNALDGDSVRIGLKDANSSCLVRTMDSDNTRHVVMPLRL
ncbi:MAG: DNA polymerase III subunit beta [Xanthomonadales bacterium]|nr:DNA polymerase III subunit beta [Xanthomonadales bacterium]